MTITQESGAAAVAGSLSQETARWRAWAAETGPADRATAEEGVRLAYRDAGLPEPERVVWAGSPREGVTLVRRGTDFGASVREAVRNAPWAAERGRMHEELGAEGWSRRWSATGGALWDTTQALVDRIRAGVLDELAPGDSAARTEIRLVLLDALLGQQDAPWLAALHTEGPRSKGRRGCAAAPAGGGRSRRWRWCASGPWRCTGTRRGGSATGRGPRWSSPTDSRCAPGAACR
ncbi:hypothetical protein SHKM778_41650 [Streptomyces sp. KM77-8]|uniref:Uncharacterized protein n=1 Tax=Streptomyces haneummycinicus TaxID=3074435 RepID=A0AAT9HK07_9ACTN